MNILPHDIPSDSPPEKGIGGRGCKYNWEEVAKKVNGLSFKEAEMLTGITYPTLRSAAERGDIQLAKNAPCFKYGEHRHDWKSIAKISHQYTIWQLSKKTGIATSSLRYAADKGWIKCKAGRKNQWAKGRGYEA